MSGDSDSCESPTAKWLTQVKGDSRRIAEEGKKPEKLSVKQCVKSAV